MTKRTTPADKRAYYWTLSAEQRDAFFSAAARAAGVTTGLKGITRKAETLAWQAKRDAERSA